MINIKQSVLITFDEEGKKAIEDSYFTLLNLEELLKNENKMVTMKDVFETTRCYLQAILDKTIW